MRITYDISCIVAGNRRVDLSEGQYEASSRGDLAVLRRLGNGF